MTVRYFWHKKLAKKLWVKKQQKLKSLLATVPVFCSLPSFNTQRPNDFHDRRRYRKLGQGPNSGKFGDAFAPRHLAPATLNFRVLELAPDEQLSRGQRLRQRRVQARRQVAQTRPIAIVVFWKVSWQTVTSVATFRSSGKKPHGRQIFYRMEII